MGYSQFKTIIFTLLLCSVSVHAQKESIAQYLDDEGMTQSSDIILTDLSQFTQSNFTLLWEHRFTDMFSLQGGIGFLAHNSIKPIFEPIYKPNALYPNLKNGYSLALTPYYLDYGFNTFFASFPMRMGIFPGQVRTTEIGVAVGRRWHLIEHFAFEVSFGISHLNEKSLDGKSYIYNKGAIETVGEVYGGRILFPISIKIGYVL